MILGLAVANSLAGIRQGCAPGGMHDQCIGERAGNTAMEEIVMALPNAQRPLMDFNKNQYEQIYKTSRLLTTDYRHIGAAEIKPSWEANAFAHESGIHQDGLIKEKITYEIMTRNPSASAITHIVMGKHSGRNAISQPLEKNGLYAE